jgi:hypothetical protein
MTNNLKKTSRITVLLLIISALTMLVAGFQVTSASRGIKVLKKYLENAEAIQPDFEKSIILYTTKTEKVFEHLMKLRPANEEDYVAFISSLENIGKQLSLDLGVKSAVEDTSGDKKDALKTLAYNISFYGTQEDLKKVISSLQDLPYFIRFDEVSYRDLDGLSQEERKEPNNAVKIKLYIK